MSASVQIRRTMKRKDGNAKATVVKNTSVKVSKDKVTVSKSKKIVPNVKSVKGN